MLIKKRTLPYQISIIGSSNKEHLIDIRSKLQLLGKVLAKYNCIILAGSGGGVGNVVAEEVKRNGGFTIGVSPSNSYNEHVKEYGNENCCFSAFIYSGFGYKGRNVLLVRSADAIIAACGESGTLNELTIAYDSYKPIGLLRNSGGVTDNFLSICSSFKKINKPQILYEANPEYLVSGIIEVLEDKYPVSGLDLGQKI